MNLVYIIGHLGVGGTENHLVQVLKRLDKSKYQPYVVCFEKSGIYLPLVEELNIPVIDLGITKIYDWRGIKKMFYLRRFCKKNKIAIIHSYLYGANMLAVVVGKLTGIPVVISYRNDNSFLNKKQMLLHKMASRFATVISAVSENIRQINIKEGIPADKIVTIHNGVELPEKTRDDISLKYKLGLKPNSLVVGTVATLTPCKGHECLLHAAAKLVSQRPDLQFLFVGDGPLRKRLENTAQLLALENKVIFVGDRDDVFQLLPLMDVFVLPSLSEGMSNALLEAMAAGLPCVTTDVGSNYEVVQDKITGYLVPPNDPDKLAQAVYNLLSDKPLAAQMGLSGKQRAADEFSMEKMISQIGQLYEQIGENAGTC